MEAIVTGVLDSTSVSQVEYLATRAFRPGYKVHNQRDSTVIISGTMQNDWYMTALKNVLKGSIQFSNSTGKRVISQGRQQGKSMALIQASNLCSEIQQGTNQHISSGYRSHGTVSGRAADLVIHDEAHLMHDDFQKAMERAFRLTTKAYKAPTKSIFYGNFKAVALTYTNGSDYHFKGHVSVELQKEKDGSETLIVKYSDRIKVQELPEGITVETPGLVGRVARIPRKLVKEFRTTNRDGSETIFGKAAL